MLISNKNKFITIDIPKTGTRSMRETLEPLGIIDVIGDANPNSEIYQHASGKDINRYLNSKKIDIKDYFIFSIVRNPWSRFFSHFNYLLKWKIKYENRNDEESWDQNMERQGFEAKRLFDTHKTDEKIIQVLVNVHISQYDYLTDFNGEFLPHFCAQIENLDKDFKTFCSYVGLSQDINLKHSNKNSGNYKSYQDFYNNKSKLMIENYEKKIVEMFEYTF